MQSMMGPYAMYGLAGAGAGLLFYYFAGRSGGPVSIPGVASKACSGAQVCAQHTVDHASNSVSTHCQQDRAVQRMCGVLSFGTDLIMPSFYVVVAFR